MYYVYEWFVLETGEIIYVGKGTRLRYKVRKHNRLFNEMIKRFRCYSRIVKTFETEAEAFEYEYEYINELKNKGQCVCNINRGGSGGSTEWWTDEIRKQYSDKNVMKSETQRKRMSENNPMKNKEIAKRVGKTKSRGVIIGDVMYHSVKSAAKAYNTYYDVISTWCRKGINSYGLQCRFEGTEQVQFTDKRYNKGGCKGLTYNGKHYESPVDLSMETGIKVDTLYKWLKNGFDIYGNPIRYDDDDRELVFTRKKGSRIPVLINGKKYPSLASAAHELNTSSTLLGNILKGKVKSTKYTCEYEYQQPNLGNTDNSTQGGSTTNR